MLTRHDTAKQAESHRDAGIGQRPRGRDLPRAALRDRHSGPARHGKAPLLPSDVLRSGRVFYGWVVVAAAFVVMGSGYSLIYSIASYDEALHRSLGAGHGAVSLLFGLAALMSLVGGLAAGPVADRIGTRPLCLAASLAYVIGLGLASRARTLWQLDLTMGLCVGAGVAAVYVPAVAALQRCSRFGAGWRRRSPPQAWAQAPSSARSQPPP